MLLPDPGWKGSIMSELKQTPLHGEHIRLGAKMVEFAGWSMPVQFEGLRPEHLAVRRAVGLFDVSHMGEIWVRGSGSLKTLQWITSNDVSKLRPGEAHYTLLTNPEGGVIDDLIVYCFREGEEYLLCVNASNIDKDYKWVVSNNVGAASIENESDRWAQIAVQGPLAPRLLNDLLDVPMDLPPFRFLERTFQGEPIVIATTGYTGERGCEVFVPKQTAVALWQELLQTGKSYEVAPIGLGARDTLRLEMAYCLYGHELTDQTNPYEAGLGWVVKPHKEFIGKESILRTKELGLKRRLVGFKMVDKGIPRHDYRLCSMEGLEIGWVTSGTHSPSLDEAIGIGYIDASLAKQGTSIGVNIRGRIAKATVVKTPFVHQKGE